jgi:hypothetical protein
MEQVQGKRPLSIYQFQMKTMPILLGWGIASICSGVVFSRRQGGFWKHLGIQFIGWGLVDAFIAGFSLFSSRRQQRNWTEGQITSKKHNHDLRQFQKIVGFNAILDVVYLVGGKRLVAISRSDERRRGAGIGIQIQGMFLLLWDMLLLLFSWTVRRG